MSTTTATLNMPVFLTGDAHSVDLTGTVSGVNVEHRLVHVTWDHPGMAQFGAFFYSGDDFLATTDRDGRVWLVLDI